MPPLQPEVIGETFDGIKILKPVTEPTSFTVAEIRKTVGEVMRDHYKRVDLDRASERNLGPDDKSAS